MFQWEQAYRNVWGFSKKLYGLYLGETNLEKVHEELNKGKNWVVVGFLHCIELFLEDIWNVSPSPVPNYSNWSYLEYFKAIDVQDTDVVFFMVLLHCFVDGLGESNQHDN